MATQLIDNIIDEAAIKKQLDNLDNQLTKTSETLGTCAVAAKVFSDSFGSAKGINDIIALQEKYNQTIILSQKAQNDMVNQQKQRVDIDLKLQKVQESNAKTELLTAQAVLATQKTLESATKAEQSRTDSSAKQAVQAAKTAQAEKALSDAEKSLIDTLNKAGISVDKLNVSKSQASSVNKLVTSINSSELGSHEQLAAQYDLNYKAYSKLSAVQRDTTAGKAMKDSLLEQSNALKKMEGDTGSFFRTIGDYKNQIMSALGLNNTFAGSLMNMAEQWNFNRKSSKDTVTDLQTVGSSMQQVAVDTELVNGSMKELGSGSKLAGNAMSVEGAGGAKAMGKELLALLANPIVLIFAAIAATVMLVKAAIDSNGEATEKLSQIMAPFKDMLAFVLNVVSELVTVFLNVTLATMGFLNSIMALIPGLDAIAAKNTQAIELEKRKQELEERGRQQTVKNSKDRLQYDDLMTKSRQKDVYSIQQRLAFLQKADAIEIEENKEKLKNSTENYNILLAQMQNEGKTYLQLTVDKRKALDDAEAAMYDTQSEYLEKTRRLHTQESKLVTEDQKEQLTAVESSQKLKLEELKSNANYANMNQAQKISFDRKYADQDIKSQMSLVKSKENLAGANYDDLENQYSILLAQLKQSHQKSNAEYAAFRLQLKQKQQDANLAMMKANSDYNNMTFDQQMTFDTKYFAQQQVSQLKIIKLTKETNAEKATAIKKLEAEAEVFAQNQALKRIQHSEKELSENASYQEADIKANENYGDKSIGYQQSLATRIFNIRADMETKVAQLKYSQNKDSVALQTSLDNIEAQRLQLVQSQKLASETDEKNKVIAIENDRINQGKRLNDEAYSNGQISASKYEKNVVDINRDGAEAQLADEIWLDKEKIANLTKLGQDYTAVQQDLDAKEALLKDKEAAKKLQKDKELATKEIALVKATVASLTTIADDQFQAECDRIEALKTKNSDAATAKTAKITAEYNSGLLTQKEADAQSAAIDAQKTARDDQLTTKENAEKTKQAKFDKEAAAFNIALDTAQAIVKDLKTPWMIPIDAAIGAVELAAVIAKPLPAYALGTEDHIGGPAIVGDGFKHELAVTPEGQFIKTENTPTVMDLPKHTKVFPDYDLAIQSLAFNASMGSINRTTPSIEINAYNDSLMRKTMGSLVSQTERQIGELGRLKNIGKSMDNVAATNLKIADAIKRNKKSDWVS